MDRVAHDALRSQWSSNEIHERPLFLERDERHGIIAVLRAAMLSLLSRAKRAARTDWSRISSARTRSHHEARRAQRFLRRTKFWALRSKHWLPRAKRLGLARILRLLL